MSRMNVNLAGVELKNPVMTASGTFGSGTEYSEFVDLNRLGAVVTKGVANVPWPGNPTPRVTETASGMLNAIGLQNPGIDVFCERDIPFLKKYDMKFGPVIDTAAYVFVLLFSWRILKEKISRGKIIGNLIIILGILVYTL